MIAAEPPPCSAPTASALYIYLAPLHRRSIGRFLLIGFVVPSSSRKISSASHLASRLRLNRISGMLGMEILFILSLSLRSEDLLNSVVRVLLSYGSRVLFH